MLWGTYKHFQSGCSILHFQQQSMRVLYQFLVSTWVLFSFESLLDCKEIQSVNPKGNQSWIFIGRTNAKDEAPILWPPDVKNRLIGKDPDAGKDWRQEEKRNAEDRMVERYHWLDGHEFEQAPGFGDGQGSLVCCSPWDHKESDTTKWLNWSELTSRLLPAKEFGKCNSQFPSEMALE